MLSILISSIFLNIFAFFNLLGINTEYAFTQLGFIIFAAVLFIIVKSLGLDYFKKNYKLFYWIFIFLLLLVFLIGDEVRGSKRWINLYFLNFQPSEIFKIIFIIFISKFLSLYEEDLEKRNTFILSLIFLLIPFFIVFKQPDLGNALSYVVIFFAILLFSKMPKKYLLNFILILFITLPIGWNLLKGYQKQRIVSFFIETENIQGSSYNIIQSKISVGSGKFLGRGLGYGTQSKLSFLPESHTDFAFSSLAEQFGFLGSLTILFLYFLICLSLIKIILKLLVHNNTFNNFYLYYTVGFLSYLTFQIFVNIAMNLGSFPVAGVSLPMISYGGSSLSTYALGIALLPFDKV